MSAVQTELFDKATFQRFDEWIHSEQGRNVANLFIRISYAALSSGMRLGAKAIWERLRWHYAIRKPVENRFKLNNNFTAYMARFAMDREPRLQGFFETRAQKGDE